MGALLTNEGLKNLQEAERGLRQRLVDAEAKKPAATVDIHNRMPDGSRLAAPDEPDTSTLTAQQKRNYAFWCRRLQSPDLTPKQREQALREILKLVPEWTPVDVRTRRQTAEKASKFFRDEVTVGPEGQRIVTRRLIEM